MSACDKNILTLPFTTSAPGADDVVIFTLPDGTSVTRKVSNFLSGSTPDDVEYEVKASGGVINDTDTELIIATFIGKRGRLYRTGIRQGKIVQSGGSSFTFTPGTGKFTWTPAASTDEIFIFEAY